jgi:nucleotide-binding universal stress UspA family protein
MEEPRSLLGPRHKERWCYPTPSRIAVAEKHLRIAERYRAEQIVRVAEDIEAGLIVMGSRGLGGVRRALIGSVSDSVIRHAHCPVLVVRPKKEQAAYQVRS